jgi:hypothetical protein
LWRSYLIPHAAGVSALYLERGLAVPLAGTLLTISVALVVYQVPTMLYAGHNTVLYELHPDNAYQNSQDKQISFHHPLPLEKDQSQNHRDLT